MLSSYFKWLICCCLAAKSASVRALLFDISFLMLCHVVQTYGSEVGRGVSISHNTKENHNHIFSH